MPSWLMRSSRDTLSYPFATAACHCDDARVPPSCGAAASATDSSCWASKVLRAKGFGGFVISTRFASTGFFNTYSTIDFLTAW